MQSLTLENLKAKDAKAFASAVTINDFQVTIPAEAEKIKTDLLDTSKVITKIEDDKTLALAVAAMNPIKAVIKEVSLTRKALDAPFAEKSKELRRLELTYIAELDAERERLLGMSNNYELRKQRKAQEEEQARQAEARKKQQEADNAAALARKLEQDAAAAKTEGERKKLAAAAIAASLEAEDAAADATPPQTILAPVKVAGFSGTIVLDFEVLNPIVFIQAYPEFWKASDENKTLKVDVLSLREELNKPAPNKFLGTTHPGELPDAEGMPPRPPGLKVFEKLRSRVG